MKHSDSENCIFGSTNTRRHKATTAFESPSRRISEHLSMTSRRFTAAVSVDLQRSEVRRASYNGNKILEDSWELFFLPRHYPISLSWDITISLYSYDISTGSVEMWFEIRATKRGSREYKKERIALAWNVKKNYSMRRDRIFSVRVLIRSFLFAIDYDPLNRLDKLKAQKIF